MADILKHQIAIIGIEDAKFTPSGGTLTDIHSIQELTIDHEFTEFRIAGDDVIRVRKLMTGEATIGLKSAALDFDAVAALTGFTFAESGVTPNVIGTIKMKRGKMPIGVLEGQGILIGLSATLAEPADVHFKIYNFSIDKLPLGMKFEEITIMDLSGKAYVDTTAASVVTLVINETKTAIA